MTREEAIQELLLTEGLIQQNGQDYLDDRDIPLLDMAIEALSADTVSREEYEEVKAYMDTLVDAFIEDGEELAESVKVVRCKDCKHWYADAHNGMVCELTNMWQPEDGFCNWGKRKGGDDE